MEKKKNTQLIIIGVLSFAILFMSVGFATYATNLTINGTTTFGQSKWSVHFDTTPANFQTTTGSQTVSKTLGETSITYSTSLNAPGEFAEFTVPIINDGTFDATLKAINMTAPSQTYVKYKVWYNGTEYSASNTSLNIDLSHTSPNNTVPVKVRVEYVQPETSSELPTTDAVNVNLSVSFDYVQKTA